MTAATPPAAPARLSARFTRQAVTYVAVGGFAALVYLGAAVGLTRGFGIAPLAASVAGFLAALPLSYLGHKFLTFASHGEHRRELPRFVLSAATGFAGSAAVPTVLAGHGFVPEAGYLATCLVVPAVNYLLLSFWVFVHGRA